MLFDGTSQVLAQFADHRNVPAAAHFLLALAGNGYSAIRPSPLTKSDTYAGGT
jgi:hypothetical protein